VGLFAKFRAKKDDGESVFTTGPILTPEQFAGVAPSGEEASNAASVQAPETAPTHPVIPPIPVPPPVIPPAEATLDAQALPTIEIPSAEEKTQSGIILGDAPRGKHARVDDLPQIASETEKSPAHAAEAEIIVPKDAGAGALAPLEAKESAEPASFEDTFFAENGFDMSGDSKKSKHRGLKIAGISAACAIAVAYGVGVGVFMGHFYPNTTGAGVDLSMKTVDEASSALEANVVDYNLAVDGKDMDLVISGNDIDFSLSGENVASKMLDKSNPWLWPYEIFQTHDVSDAYTTDFNEAKLAEICEKAIAEHNETAVPTKDAKLGFVESSGKIGVVPESYGTELVPQKVVTKISDGVMRAQRKVTLDDKDVVEPRVLSTDQGLKKAAENAQKISHADVKLTINDEPVAEINAKQYAEWLSVGEDYSVSLDEGKMNDYLSDLCASFSTVGSTRTYTRPDGKVITVSGGSYGWEADTDSLLAAVKDAVANNTVGNIEVPVWQSAQVFTAPGEQDWGSRYVDVDISEQYVRFYDGGEIIWESDCITGAGYDYERITPEGVYAVTNKANNVPLRPWENGRQVEEPTYVTYWMPFIGNMIGLHDAWWQPYFGGSAYLDGLGSHGCINLPTYAAADLFNIIEIGDVVITHY